MKVRLSKLTKHFIILGVICLLVSSYFAYLHIPSESMIHSDANVHHVDSSDNDDLINTNLNGSFSYSNNTNDTNNFALTSMKNDTNLITMLANQTTQEDQKTNKLKCPIEMDNTMILNKSKTLFEGTWVTKTSEYLRFEKNNDKRIILPSMDDVESNATSISLSFGLIQLQLVQMACASQYQS